MGNFRLKFCLFYLVIMANLSLEADRLPLLISPLSIQDSNGFTQLDKDKKKTIKIPTSWGGSSLSQETKQVEGIDVTVYSLSGGAWIYHKTVKLSASSIEVLGEDAYKGYLKGQTKVEDLENGITLTAGKGTYDKVTETIVLDGRPTLIFKDKEKKTTKITAPYLKRYIGENKTVFEGGAIIENSEFTIYSNSAVFWEKEETLTMEEYPFIFGKDTFLTGEKVTYSNSSKNTTLEKDTILLKLSFESKKKKKSEPKELNEQEVNYDKPQESDTKEKIKQTSIFTGEKLIYQSGDETSRFVGLFGNAKMTREDYEFTASYMKAFGKNNGNLEAKESVVFFDKENHVRLSGDTLEHNKEKDYTHITDNSKIEFLDKENVKVNSTLTAVEIERFGDKKEMVTRGNVEIVSESSTIKGEYATYFEESEKIYVEGNPSMRKDNKTLYCGKIIIYPNLDKIILADGLNVNKK